MICEYGCGKEALFQFKNGKWCCSSNYRKCIGCIPWNKGLKNCYSEDTIQKLKNHGIKGKKMYIQKTQN